MYFKRLVISHPFYNFSFKSYHDTLISYRDFYLFLAGSYVSVIQSSETHFFFLVMLYKNQASL